MNLFSGSLLLVLCILAELLIFKFTKKEIPWREVVYNVNSGHIFMWICRAVEIIIFTFVLNHFSFGWVGTWSVPAQWVFTFIGWDFCFYWLHRMHHKIPLFWKIHVVHHEGEHFGLSLGLRNSWYSSLSSIPFFLTLAVLGVPVEIFIGVSAVHYFIQFYNHNGVVTDSGILEKFMVTPAKHRVHHGLNPEYIDKNFCGTFNIWDKLFGTYQQKIEGVDIIYGVHEPTNTDNPFWGNNVPFIKESKLKVPGFGKNLSNKFYVHDLYIGSGGLSLLSLWLYYIYCEGQDLGMHQVSLFFINFLGTIALGALSDHRLSGMIGWMLITLVSPVFFVVNYNIHDPMKIALFVIFFLHGLYGMKYFININSGNELNSSEV